MFKDTTVSNTQFVTISSIKLKHMSLIFEANVLEDNH